MDSRLIVIDSSIIAATFLASSRVMDAELLFQRALAKDVILTAPALLWIECANMLLKLESEGKISSSAAREWQSGLGALPITTEALPVHNGYGDTLCDIARQYGIAAADSAYLELALRRGAKLASCKTKLLQAASAAGCRWEA